MMVCGLVKGAGSPARGRCWLAPSSWSLTHRGGFFAPGLADALRVEVQYTLHQRSRTDRPRRTEVGNLFVYTARIRRRIAFRLPPAGWLARPRWPSTPTPCKFRLVNCKPPSPYSTAWWMNSNAGSSRDSSPFASATAEILCWPTFSGSTCALLLVDASNCWMATSPIPGRTGALAARAVAAPTAKAPAIISVLEKLFEQDTAGDPMRGLRWSHRTSVKIRCTPHRIRIFANTVARLLHDIDYARRKIRVATTISDSITSPICVSACCRRRMPLLSVETKTRELFGNFKNSDATWARFPRPVCDHDFPLRLDWRRYSVRHARSGRQSEVGRGWRLAGHTSILPFTPSPVCGSARACSTMPAHANY